jgi:hypothetical protein
MSVIISDQANSISFLYSDGEEVILDKDNLNIKKRGRYIWVTNSTGFIKGARNDVLRLRYTEVTSPSVASNDLLIDAILGFKASSGYTVGDVRITDGTDVLAIESDGSVNVRLTDGTTDVTIEPNGSLPVTLQDQTTPTVITKFSILEETTTTTAPIAIGDYVIPVTSATGISAGKYLSIFDPTSIRFTNFVVVSVASLNVTVDRPVDFAYPSGSYVDVQETNLNVNGSVTPVVAGIRNNAGGTPPPGIALSVDITRIMFSCVAASTVDLTLFADIAALTRGLTLRKRDGNYYNIFNVKSNGEMGGIMYDFTIHSSGVGQQGVDGFLGRLTFAGQNKMGVVQRLALNEDLEIIIQDNLTGITDLEIIAEGSIVQP